MCIMKTKRSDKQITVLETTACPTQGGSYKEQVTEISQTTAALDIS